MSDIKIKEENLFCDNIKGNEIFPAQQVSERPARRPGGSTLSASPRFKEGFLRDLVSYPVKGPRGRGQRVRIFYSPGGSQSSQFVSPFCVHDLEFLQNSNMYNVDIETSLL